MGCWPIKWGCGFEMVFIQILSHRLSYPSEMAENLALVVRPWMERLDSIEWLNFQNEYHLSAFRYLREFSIRPPLLHAAVQFWDPQLHVFRVGSQEFCPTIEEFGAYLGCASSHVFTIPMLRTNFPQILAATLGVGIIRARFLVQDGALNIRQLVETYIPRAGEAGMVRPPEFYFAFCLCILAAFVFVPADGRVSPHVVGVATQLRERKNIAPMVLAETILGLDMVRRGDTREFAGCPLVLQVNFFFFLT